VSDSVTRIVAAGPGAHRRLLLVLQELRVAYFECKRGQLDMRTRIRGPKGGMSKPEDK
jgi:hypothetical protein